MPVYEFVCTDCNAKFDTRVANFEAAKDVHCRDCEGQSVRRLVSGFAMVGGLDQPISASTGTGGGGCCGGGCGCGH